MLKVMTISFLCVIISLKCSMVYDIVCVLQGEFGPFNPSMHSRVPLWLAVHLKQRQKCRIEPPDWMTVGEMRMMYAKKKKKKERN